MRHLLLLLFVSTALGQSVLPDAPQPAKDFVKPFAFSFVVSCVTGALTAIVSGWG